MSVLSFRRVSAAVLVVFGFTVLEAAAGPAEIAQIKPRQDKLRDMGGALKAITDDYVHWPAWIGAQRMTPSGRSSVYSYMSEMFMMRTRSPPFSIVLAIVSAILRVWPSTVA